MLPPRRSRCGNSQHLSRARPRLLQFRWPPLRFSRVRSQPHRSRLHHKRWKACLSIPRRSVRRKNIRKILPRWTCRNCRSAFSNPSLSPVVTKKTSISTPSSQRCLPRRLPVVLTVTNMRKTGLPPRRRVPRHRVRRRSTNLSGRWKKISAAPCRRLLPRAAMRRAMPRIPMSTISRPIAKKKNAAVAAGSCRLPQQSVWCLLVVVFTR
ncbi:hypothetical protein D3C87_1357930 [compost metagenome]